MKQNKYIYIKVIQQYYSPGYGWEDCAEYDRDDRGRFDRDLINHDLKEYRLMGYPTRLISRRSPNPNYIE